MLDESAFDDAFDDDPDVALGLLADLTGATDERLRALARRLAGRLMVDVARRGRARQGGIGKIERRRYQPDAGDLDLDASLEAITELKAGMGLDVERLHVRTWARPDTAACLVVDRSGSMSGRPLAANAIAAAAVSLRAPAAWSVLSFSSRIVVVKGMLEQRSCGQVVDAVLALRGHGTTDLAGALGEARRQLAMSSAARRVAILLSDCRSTEPGDVVAAAGALDELAIIAPRRDDVEARRLADTVGASIATIDGPSDVPHALTAALR